MKMKREQKQLKKKKTERDRILRENKVLKIYMQPNAIEEMILKDWMKVFKLKIQMLDYVLRVEKVKVR